MKYLMNTRNGMALAETHNNELLKDGMQVTYVIDGNEYQGEIQSKTGHKHDRKWTCKYINKYGDYNENLSVSPVLKENGEIYFYLDQD